MGIEKFVASAKIIEKKLLSKKAISIYFAIASIGCIAGAAISIKDLYINHNLNILWDIIPNTLMAPLSAYGSYHLYKERKK